MHDQPTFDSLKNDFQQDCKTTYEKEPELYFAYINYRLNLSNNFTLAEILAQIKKIREAVELNAREGQK
jgi:hypothetical protein